MNGKVIIALALALLLTSCAQRNPERVGFLNMTIYEMFPNDQQLRTLAQAASSGDIKTIDKLVAGGVDVNSVGGRGLPPAYWVLYHPNEEGFKRLFEHGANPNRILTTSFWNKKRYDSLIHAAARSSLYEGSKCLKVLLEYGNGNPNLMLPDDGSRPIQYAVFPGQEIAFALLYNAGAEIDYNDTYNSLLTHAIGTNFELTYFLLEQGVDLTYRTKAGRSVAYLMEMAAKYKMWTTDKEYMFFWRCVAFLEKRGVHIDLSADLKRPTVLETTPPRILKLINKR